MYEVIDKELGIVACGLEDLTAEYVAAFLGSWERGAKIGALTLFSDEQGNLVLNRDHKNYQFNLELAQSYMAATEEQRKAFKEECTERLSEELNVMDKLIEKREADIEMHRAFKANDPEDKEWHITSHIFQKHPDIYGATLIFQYGVMQGKRVERAKKKRQSVIVGGVGWRD